jgi:hypothetical protein
MRVACGERNGSFSMKGILIEVLGSTLWESPGRSTLMEDTVFLFKVRQECRKLLPSIKDYRRKT